MSTHPSGARNPERPLAGAAASVALVVVLFISSGAFDLGTGSHRPALGSNPGTGFPPPSGLAPLAIPKNNHYDWPEFHHNPALNGYASNSPLSSANASALGVAWATNLYGAALDSPAVAYDPLLGETLVYVGTDTGDFVAVNLANGAIVWGVWLGSPIRSSPLVVNGSVFVVPFSNGKIVRLNATTGATLCSTALPGTSEATPTYGTPPGGVPTVFLGTEAPSPQNGAFVAINAGNCSIEWEFSGYHQPAGSWDPASYVVNASGGPMVLFGTDDPDSSVYALNALTGHLLWRFQCYNPPGKDFDVGAGPSVALPGSNGFSQGVVYVTNGADIAYALHLNNGTLLWETNFFTLSGLAGTVEPRARSTPALDGKDVIFGFNLGLIDLNARTGKLLWIYDDVSRTESIAAPAIAGPTHHAIVVTGDVGGSLDVLSRTGGTLLYSYPTGGWIAASPAISGGNIVVASSDGFLLDFALGGGDDALLPTTSITSPLAEATLPNSNGSVSVSGTAMDAVGVAAVEVAIQSGDASGPWWDGATQTWSPGPINNRATLVSPGAGSTAWSFPFPVPAAGGTYEVISNAQSIGGQTDPNGASVDFVVNYSTSGPYLRASSAYVAPGGALTISGGGFGPSAQVTIGLYGKSLAKMTSASDGSLPPTSVVIPKGSTFGPTSLTAMAKGSGRSSSTSITIANSWAQLSNGPGHTGFEPNDPSLHQVIFPGNDYWLKVAWRFSAPTSLTSSPAVVDGRAYVGDSVGNLYAIDLLNGGLLWNSTLPTGAAIDGSPAVDPALGQVFVGANDGTLYSYDLSNGTPAWSVSLGGIVSAPVISNGELYVTTTAGGLDDLAESSGAVLWSMTLGSAATAAPTLNDSSHLLVVGEADGQVLGLNSTTGATRWNFGTGGAVTAAPLVTRGKVYVSSSDDSLYALNQSTGGLRWSFRTGGAIQDTATVDNWGLLYVGSDDGYLYVLDASGGREKFNFSVGSPIVGESSTEGVTVFEDAAGTIGAQKTFVEGNASWRFPTGGPLWTIPVIVDSAVFVAAGDGTLYAFTTLGQGPV
ncbi:MAG: PQQ-binding-like beta-propeller repeat protein [Thermoplasmata archaeon]|nr:PQQ-binding-like beta-propeller repeat protein [Thermoplasmata archaeon]